MHEHHEHSGGHGHSHGFKKSDLWLYGLIAVSALWGYGDGLLEQHHAKNVECSTSEVTKTVTYDHKDGEWILRGPPG